MTDASDQKIALSRLFRDFSRAQEAVYHLEQAGIPADDISVIANNSDKWFSPDWMAAAAKGAAVGAGFGGVGGLLAGLGMLAVPGFGPIVAAGWLAAMVAGAGAVGVAGGLVGVIAEAGVATNDAELYAESIRRGGSFISVRVPEKDRARFEAILDPESVNLEDQHRTLTAAGWVPGKPAA